MPLPQQPEVDSDVSVIQLLSHLNGIPFMGSAEIRDGPFGLLGDILDPRNSRMPASAFAHGGSR